MKSYKFKLKPSKGIESKFNAWLDVCRELYNSALQERREAWELNKISVNYHAQSAQLPEIKKLREDVAQVNAQALQSTLRRLSKTFDAFFTRIKRGEKAGYPRFKGGNFFDSFTFPQMKGTVRIQGNKLILSKIGSVRFRFHREIIGTIKTCTIKREDSGWFVIFAVDDEPQPLPKTGESVGVDAGISSFLTLSDGTRIDNFKYYESTQKKLRVAQRRVSRRKKGSNQRRKAVLQFRKIHQKIRNQRNDFQHKVSRCLVNNYDFIAIEKLVLLGLSRGILSKQVNDVAWSSFFQKLKSKAECADKRVIEVPAAYTSQACSQCGNQVKKDLSVRIHHCVKCGLKICRDLNAAINIKNIALGKSVKAITYQVADCVALEAVAL